MLLLLPFVEELHRRFVAKRRMQALTVIKDLDVFKGNSLDVDMGFITNAMHSLVLEAVEPTLGRRVTPAVVLTTHRADHAVFLEFVRKRMAGILAATVGVMHQSRRWTLPDLHHPSWRHEQIFQYAHNPANSGKRQHTLMADFTLWVLHS